MAQNAFMHPRNIYRTPPDFKALVDGFPDIRKHVTTDVSGKVKYDFKDPDALRVLTQTLLLKDFQLDVEIPADKLVPTLPNRLNYILWLEDIVRALKLPKDETVVGLDLGTGPCAVYALLGARRGWRMVATERDADSLAVARRNVQKNSLQQLVQVLEADASLVTGPLQSAGPVHFTLCNPPFFDSESPAEGGEARARRPVACPGGERAFVGRLIAESPQLADRCRVFTTMLGHKSSVRPMKRLAYEAGAAEVITTELCQGNTKRWAMGWTFQAGLALDQVKGMKQTKKRAPVQCVVPRDMDGIPYDIPSVKQRVVGWLEELQTEVEPGKCNKYFASYKVTAAADTWTHNRRRRRAQERLGATSDLEPSPSSAELAGSPDPDFDHEPGAEPGSDLSDLSWRSDTAEPPPKRPRADSESAEPAAAAAETGPAAKRPCLEARLGAVSLAEPKPRPALVFTLFVQKKGHDILLQMTLLTGKLAMDGMNGVLLFLKNKMRQRLVMSTSSGPAAGAVQGSGAAAGPSAAVKEGMGRVLHHLRDKMRQKIRLDSPAAGAATEPASQSEPGSVQTAGGATSSP
ncbi:RNA N6-adenosine-methyltransferase mettl16-like [Pollicipes pollicipes]|uniref:RNA N6-adenosine-methyltransferase mettl16-like n=1 Tax=Pollicipes pollicipes TaxID=41117 RepID=UPI001884FFA4|nr:RNA N6-adenosine-methyltransferase mettl16-like [Pollicipes pollicipes]